MKSKRFFNCILAVSVFSMFIACSGINDPADITDSGDPQDPKEPEITVVDSTSAMVTKAAEFDYTATYKAVNVPKGSVIDKIEIGAEVFRPKQNSSYVKTDWLYAGKDDFSDQKDMITLYLSVAENTAMEDRNAVVSLKGDLYDLVFNVTQKGRTEPFLVFEERKDIELEAAQKQLLQSNCAFSIGFFKEVYAREASQEVMVSPFCVESAMCMLANGAKGETYNEIVKALGYSGYGMDDVNAAYHALLTGLQEVDRSATLASANALWLDIVNCVLPEFQNTVRDRYDAMVETLDFADSKTLEHINAWGSERTEGMISQMLPRIEDNWKFILANALYFKGMWKEKFDKDKTCMAAFHSLSGKDTNMDFMHGELPCKYSYSNELEAALCELPFGNGAFVLDILLPEPEKDFNKFVGELYAKNWSEAVAALQARNEIIVLPKIEFSFAGEESIVEALKAMGISLIFDSVNSDLSLLCQPSAVIGTAFHNVSFKMDEDGAKAAATMILPGWDTSPGPSPEFVADHPFVLAIREISTDTLIFFGAYKGI